MARIVREKRHAAAVEKHILDGLIAYNRPFAGPERYRRLVISAREGRRIVGGLVGDCLWNFVHVHLLWVDEAARGKDHGTKLMREAERVARERGAALVWLNTFSFQAPKFYEKLGYRRFSALKGTPVKGATRFFYAKRLRAV